LAQQGFYEGLEAKARRLADGIKASIAKHEASACLSRVGSMMTLFFRGDTPQDYASARQADSERYARFFHALLDTGVYFPPSQYEASFVSAAHSEADIDATIAAVDAALEVG
jgi:glutamate-1-semialdehyde 2,1-aminomutase